MNFAKNPFERPFASFKVTTKRLGGILTRRTIQEARDGFQVAVCSLAQHDEDRSYCQHFPVSHDGFTLLEVIIALMLFGVLVAILTFQLRPLLAQAHLHDAARQMVANLQYVRMKAVSQNRRLRVTFRSPSQDYVVDKDEDGVWQRQLLHSHTEVEAPEATITFPRDVCITAVNSGGDVIFLPRGAVDGGISITLGTVGGSDTKRVVVNLAGRVRVE